LTEVGQRRVDEPAAPGHGGVVEAVRRERARSRALEEDVGASQQPAQQVLPRRAAGVAGAALLAGVVPPAIETAVRLDRVLHEPAAPPPWAARRRLHLDHPRATVGEELARPLVLPIGQLDHGETVVDAAHRHPPSRFAPYSARVPADTGALFPNAGG